MKKEFNPNAYNILKERGFIKVASHENELKEMLERGPITFYLGIDPTANNLHIGHFFAMQMFRILQDHGHNGILLLGNATAMIGDPSFKNDMRKMMSQEDINRNADEIESILHKFIDIKNTKIVHNADWMKNETYVGFMRKVGTHFNVAKMLAAECYKNRIKEGGLTFLEMGYMLMQGFDFVHLNDEYGCTLQIGGSDQWGNIVAGVDLSRRMSYANGEERPLMIGLCCPLLVKADGTKMGKTESGVLWVSRTGAADVYNCYQHFFNVFDEDVERLLTFFTSLPVAEIKKLCKDDIVYAKKVMAYKVTEKIHGTEAAATARDTAAQLFASGNATPSDTPTETVTLPKNSNIVDILAKTSIISSKREARELLAAGAILVDGNKVTDPNFAPDKTEILIKKGKKTFLKAIIKGE